MGISQNFQLTTKTGIHQTIISIICEIVPFLIIVKTGILKKTNTTGFSGVSFDSRSNKFRAYVSINKKQVFLGNFNNLNDAIFIRHITAKKEYGDYMRLPEPPPTIPNKAMIATAIKSGIEVPGAHLAQSTRLVIK